MCLKRQVAMAGTVLLTGGIGSGKTAVSRYLISRGVPVYDCDSMTRRLYDTDRELVRSIEEALGLALSLPDGTMDRKALAREIFGNGDSLAKVERIVHPAVLEDFCRWRDAMDMKIREEGWCGYAGCRPFVVMESAIAMEKHIFDGSYDRVVLVDAPLDIRVERASRRDSSPREQILGRMAAQRFDVAAADAVINNDLDLDTLAERTDIAFKLLYL